MTRGMEKVEIRFYKKDFENTMGGKCKQRSLKGNGINKKKRTYTQKETNGISGTHNGKGGFGKSDNHRTLNTKRTEDNKHST